MLRVFLSASVALMLAGCASAPKASITHPVASIAHKVPAFKKAAKPVETPVAAEKPKTFKERWFDRFMKHKPK